MDISFSDNNKKALIIQTTVKTSDRTGVEMEVLTAVQIAALTVYDMCKAMDRGMTISDSHLVAKSGGKSEGFYYDEE